METMETCSLLSCWLVLNQLSYITQPWVALSVLVWILLFKVLVKEMSSCRRPICWQLFLN